MAAGEDGEHTRFPCLAMVRYAVATVVTVLAAAVVVMAIHVVLRSEDVHLSIDYGYIEADGLWWVTEAYGADELPTQVIQTNIGTSLGGEQAVSEAAAAAVAHTATSSAQSSSSSSRDSISPVVSSSGAIGKRAANGADELPVQKKLKQARARVSQSVNLRVILSAQNPGGRSNIDCNIATIRVLDMRNASQEIFQFDLGNFTVPQQTAHTQTKLVEVNDTNVLAYIKKQYHGETSFSVMVQVDAIITSYPLGRKTNSNNQTYFCWPVTVGLIARSTLPGNNVACKTREETQLRVGLPLPVGAGAGAG